MRLPPGVFSPAHWKIAVVACVLALAACGRSIGEPFDVTAATVLTPGKSTYEDAVKQFGIASHVKGYGQGTVAHWHYLKNTPEGTEYASVTIMFGRDSRMVRIIERVDSSLDDR